MRGRTALMSLAAASLVLVVACEDGQPTQDDQEGLTSQDSTQEPDLTQSPSIEPAEAMDPELKCLIEGSPWDADLDALVPFVAQDVSMGIIDQARMTGTNRMTVDEDLAVRAVQDTRTTMSGVGGGMTFQAEATTRGVVTGAWRFKDGKLHPLGRWRNSTTSNGQVVINGKAAPFQFEPPSVDAAITALECRGRTLKLTAAGAPYTIPFRSAR